MLSSSAAAVELLCSDTSVSSTLSCPVHHFHSQPRLSCHISPFHDHKSSHKFSLSLSFLNNANSHRVRSAVVISFISSEGHPSFTAATVSCSPFTCQATLLSHLTDCLQLGFQPTYCQMDGVLFFLDKANSLSRTLSKALDGVLW